MSSVEIVTIFMHINWRLLFQKKYPQRSSPSRLLNPSLHSYRREPGHSIKQFLLSPRPMKLICLSLLILLFVLSQEKLASPLPYIILFIIILLKTIRNLALFTPNYFYFPVGLNTSKSPRVSLACRVKLHLPCNKLTRRSFNVSYYCLLVRSCRIINCLQN